MGGHVGGTGSHSVELWGWGWGWGGTTPVGGGGGSGVCLSAQLPGRAEAEVTRTAAWLTDTNDTL